MFERVGLQRNETKRLVSRIVEFIATINGALSKDRMIQDAEGYEGNENRKAVQKHLQRERRSHLATLRKQYDNFVCQVCGFDYTKIYGNLGDDFAEAHHIVPLGKNDNQRITTIDDLITVCANCHRMLHRLNGEAGDITKLKKTVNKKQ
jgi:predicted HNH restriction endonuclease